MNRVVLSGEILDLCLAQSKASKKPISIQGLAAHSEHLLDIVVGSPQMRKVIEAIQRFAPYGQSMLVHGESGTGKELVARALHALGPAPDGPFVTFNCSNLVPSLAESQLFGHIRGAFTDAREDSLGYFRSANGGTLFLDEVGELPLELQPKLLRAVENHEVHPVGSAHNCSVEIRIITATNRDLRAMTAAGRFRDDLYYRLNSAAVTIPPLRERSGDVAALLGHFISRLNPILRKRIEFISPAALRVLLTHHWPGNVREFSNSIRNAMIMTDDDLLDVHALPEGLPKEDRDSMAPRVAGILVDAGPLASTMTLNEIIDEVSRRALEHALRTAHGSCQRAANLLGVSRFTVYRMLSRYGMEPMRARLNETAGN